jgi:hypothetical protein
LYRVRVKNVCPPDVCQMKTRVVAMIMDQFTIGFSRVGFSSPRRSISVHVGAGGLIYV